MRVVGNLMAFTRSDVLATAERSPAAAGARDKDGVGWAVHLGRTGRGPGRLAARTAGEAAIARFYDTFIGPRDIRYRADVDIVTGSTVVRDGELEIAMATDHVARSGVHPLRPAERTTAT